MKIAVIADAHANLEALEAVFADADRLGADEYVCLGDCIGYGPDPEAVVTQLALRQTVAVAGNHEHGLFDPESTFRFTEEARRSIHYARDVLSAGARLWLSMLPDVQIREGARFVHGMPPDSFSRYIHQCPEEELRSRFAEYPEDLCFVGHTHLRELIRLMPDGAILTSPLAPGRMELPPHCRHICNVGSVGQPRGGSKDAEYVLWDTEDRSIVARSVPYDSAKTAAKIKERGLPVSLCRWLE